MSALGNGTKLPARNTDYHHRPRLEARMGLTARRLTVLRAPCGFGKTALLLDACHAEQGRGASVFWLSCARDPEGGRLARELARAMRDFAHAVPGSRGVEPMPGGAIDAGREVSMSALSTAPPSRPFVLVLDDAELLRSADAVAALNSLIRHGPPDLHIGLAMRVTPPGLDIATPIVDGCGTLLTGEDLRFTDAEIAGYLGRGPQRRGRRELASVARMTQGWPLAVGIARNLHRSGGLDELTSAQYRNVIDDHTKTRLLRGLAAGQREYLARLALPDTFDPEVLAVAFPDDHAHHYENISSALGALIRPLDSGRGTLALHPLARDILRARPRSVDDDRARRTHRRLAEAIMKRHGSTAGAVAHAVAADDPALCEAIIKQRGCLAVLAIEGVAPFLDICRHLTADMVDRAPGLAAMHIIGLLFQDRLGEATEFLERHAERLRELQAGAVPDHDRLAAVEMDMAEALWGTFACNSNDDWTLARLVSSVTRSADADWLPAVYRGAMCTILMAKDIQRARFETGHRRGTMARDFFRLVGGGFGVGIVDMHLGIAAMAQGRVEEAASDYERSGLGPMAGVLAQELRIERNRHEPPRTARPEAMPWVTGWFEVQASDHGNRAELAFDRGGPRAALDALSASLDRVRRQGLPRLERLIGAQRAFWLVRAGDAAASRRVWVEAELPDAVVDLVDLSRQSWREFEAVVCARIAWLAATGEVDAARRLASTVAAMARGWGLKRALMRCFAIWSALEHRAANAAAARAHLGEFLSLYRDTDYSRPLVREGDAPVAILEDLIARDPAPDIRPHALELLGVLGGNRSAGGQERLTEKELEVLNGLAHGMRNKEIARSLGITDSGVRYHLKAIYRTLGTNSRLDAVRTARKLGIVLNP